MKLLVDIGNTCIKWALEEGQSLALHGSLERQGDPMEDLLVRGWTDIPRPSRILVSNVAGDAVAEELSRWALERWGLVPELARVRAQACGVRNGYAQAQQLGVDRWLALIAVRSRCKTAACIVDCGTAVTIDALSSEGEHLGGLIAPGIIPMQRALIAHTHGIGAQPMGEPAMLARNTRDGITAGAVYAIAGCIALVSARLSQDRRDLGYFITGGDASRILPLLAPPFELVPDLVLQGLVVAAQDSAI